MADTDGREKEGDRIALIDVIRSFSMLYIVGYWHLTDYLTAWRVFRNQAMLIITICCLGSFVYISGFLISRFYTFSKIGDIGSYFKKRLVRIYPPYLIALTLFFVLEFVNRAAYVQSALLLNMILDLPLRTLWFVTLIVVLYVIAPLFLYRYNILKTIAITVFLYGVMLFLHRRTGFIDLRLPQYLVPFAFGVIAGRSRPIANGAGRWMLAAICLGCIVVFGFLHGGATDEIVRTVLLDLIMISAIPVVVVIASWAATVLDAGKVVLFSYSTFAIYLSHRIIFWAGLRLFKPESLAASLVYLVLVLLPVTVVLSYVAQRTYDSIIGRLGL